MAIENFKPTLWEGAIMENFHENSFVSLLTTPPVEVKAEKVVFNRIQKGVWKDYITNSKISWDQVSTTKVEMDFPKQKYYAFMVEDVDQVQLKGDVLKPLTREQSATLAEEIDREVIDYIFANIYPSNVLGTEIAPIVTNKGNAYDNLVDLNTVANNNKIPVTEKYFIISPSYLALLQKDTRFTNNYKILSNGLVEGDTICGNQLIVKADNPSDKIGLVHKSGTGFAMQLDGSAEALRLVDYIGDGVRGLAKYGYVKLRDESTALMHIQIEG